MFKKTKTNFGFRNPNLSGENQHKVNLHFLLAASNFYPDFVADVISTYKTSKTQLFCGANRIIKI